MEKIKYILYTHYYYYNNVAYYIDDENNICQTTRDNIEFSGNWKLRGFREILPFGRLSNKLYTIEELEGKDLCFKNGKGKYMIEDLDHNTIRIWGGSEVHRLMSIRKEVAR